jgi:RHS repeat-associated protein
MLRRSWQCADMDPDNVVLDDEFMINQTNAPENELYFYHTDHLGSSSWITDASRAVNQHIQYLPFGESFISQKVSSYDVRYKFTGKERDAETGYVPKAFGIGARYYSSELSVWLSVDPLAGKYPSTSPFIYVLGNPIRYTDPDGRWVKGAGFWRNMFKSDNRINAENRVRELKKQGIDASMSRNRKAGGWDVAYVSHEFWPADLDAKGSTLSSLTIENFSRKNRNNEFVEAVRYIDRAMDNGMRNLTKPLGKIKTRVGSIPHKIAQVVANINPLVSITNAYKIFFGDGKNIYEEEVDDGDKVLSILEVTTFGVASTAKYIPTSIISKDGVEMIKSVSEINGIVLDIAQGVKTTTNSQKKGH